MDLPLKRNTQITTYLSILSPIFTTTRRHLCDSVLISLLKTEREGAQQTLVGSRIQKEGATPEKAHFLGLFALLGRCNTSRQGLWGAGGLGCSSVGEPFGQISRA